MSNKCSGFHSAQGIAAETEFVLQSASQPGFLEANLATVSHIAEFERDGTSIILLKPSNQIDHNGGKDIEVNGEEYKALAELVRQLKNPVVCEDVGNDRFAGVQLLDNRATLRKATLTPRLSSRRSTAATPKTSTLPSITCSWKTRCTYV